MRNWMKQLGASLGFIFALGGSSTALAYPPQCVEICTCSSSCATPCYYGMAKGYHCSDELCVDLCASAKVQDSTTQEQKEACVQPDAQESQGASLDVCTEQSPRAVSIES